MIAWSPAAPMRPACPHRRLRRLLARELPHGLALGASTLRQWASASFVGARHIFPCAFAAGEAEPLRRSLAAHLEAVEWRLAGHVVADIAVESDAAGAMLRIEVLTVED
ncbi:hypothetical protein [Sphingopyxis indica]|uniref:Uncharacterized protein n=1 Tax=Sphingopyxis indica TaxID=436663 RepID=A0A239KFV1_9SPHN|nr:hypothetical protein [Sphingopyxis indica]SNT17197.1 hypothetical protein SAMN06295955_11435 [Sphingopyxis indica]